MFGRNLNEEKLIKSGNYVRTELPIRLAHRIRDFQVRSRRQEQKRKCQSNNTRNPQHTQIPSQPFILFKNLPFIVGTNPHIEAIYNLYWEAFEAFRAFPPIVSLADNSRFCTLLASMLQTHLVVIQKLAVGITETADHMNPMQADRFLNEMIRSRISRRVLAQQHMSLSSLYSNSNSSVVDGGGGSLMHGVGGSGGSNNTNLLSSTNHHHESAASIVGVVNTKCNAVASVEACTQLAGKFIRETYGLDPPAVVIDGHRHVTFTYIPSHLQYILYELLKNSMQHTLLFHLSSSLTTTLSPPSTNSNDKPLQHPSSMTGTSNNSTSQSLSMAEEALAQARQRSLGPLIGNTSSFSSSALSATSTLSSPTTLTTSSSSSSLPVIRVTIGEGDAEVMFRVSDQGGGIPKELMENVWSFWHVSDQRGSTTTNEDNAGELVTSTPSSSTLTSKAVTVTAASAARRDRVQRLGMGLCLARAYANYWGGTISLQSLNGFGTDAYLSIMTGNQHEVID